MVAQREYKNPVTGGRSIRLDIYAESSDGNVYDIEVQNDDAGADAHRARFHSSMLDSKMLKEKQKFKEIHDSYVIFITKNDYMKMGLPMYHVERTVQEAEALFGDGSHIIYVNGRYKDDTDPVGKLMQDFRCTIAVDMFYQELAKPVRHFKETAGGRSQVCKAMEERIDRERVETLFDVEAWKKKGNPFWNILMGKPLVVSVCHVVAQDPDISVQELIMLPACPSQFIMDNLFYYGECEIIGNVPLTGEVDYPVMYGKSISALEPDKIIFCRGKEYREFSQKDMKPIRRSYPNNSIGWTLDVDKNVVEQCIQKKSNQPYWDQDLYGMDGDLRNPKNGKEYRKIMEQITF